MTCPTCGSDKKELRKLVQLHGDELCPNCQWDKCTDDWHEDSGDTQHDSY
jgi:hypothetical protein